MGSVWCKRKHKEKSFVSRVLRERDEQVLKGRDSVVRECVQSEHRCHFARRCEGFPPSRRGKTRKKILWLLSASTFVGSFYFRLFTYRKKTTFAIKFDSHTAKLEVNSVLNVPRLGNQETRNNLFRQSRRKFAHQSGPFLACLLFLFFFRQTSDPLIFSKLDFSNTKASNLSQIKCKVA